MSSSLLEIWEQWDDDGWREQTKSSETFDMGKQDDMRASRMSPEGMDCTYTYWFMT
jgi:hypothetical protein